MSGVRVSARRRLWDSCDVDFSVTSVERDGIEIVTVSGDLDAHAAPTLQTELDPKSANGARLVVDLSGVDFIDSTGLGVLVTTLKHVRESGGSLAVVVVAARVRKVFAITGLDHVITLRGTLDEALG